MEKSLYLTFLWMLLIFIASSIPGNSLPGQMPPDYVSHFIEYFILGFFLHLWISTRIIKKHPLLAIISAIIICSIYGMMDEFYQSFIPGRFSDPRDWVTDSIGASIGALFTFALFNLKEIKHEKRA